jgi:hypothetical protein
LRKEEPKGYLKANVELISYNSLYKQTLTGWLLLGLSKVQPYIRLLASILAE